MYQCFSRNKLRTAIVFCLHLAWLSWCPSEWQFITTHTIQFPQHFAKFHTVRFHLISRSSDTLLVTFQAFVCHSKYSVELKHVLHCSDYCCYVNFAFDCKMFSTRLVWQLFHCLMCRRWVVWKYVYKKYCDILEASLRLKGSTGSFQSSHIYRDIFSSLTLVQLVAAKELSRCWRDEHYNDDTNLDIFLV